VGPVGCVRGDSSFAKGSLLDALEKRGIAYVFRMANNPLLDRLAAPYLVVPKGERPKQPREWVYSLDYKSRRWPKKRRVILVVQETPGELYLHHFFLVTSEEQASPEQIVEHYRQRGTSEARFGEFKSRLEPKLSCTTQDELEQQAAWRANASTFQLYLLADGLLHALRWITKKRLSSDGESLPKLARVQRWLVDVAARITTSARRVHVHVAHSARDLWAWALTRMGRLRTAT
jgi:DDE family transposase